MNKTLTVRLNRSAQQPRVPSQRHGSFKLLCLALALGNWVAHASASAPILNLPASVTLREDSSTNLTVGISDAAVAIFTVTSTAKSSNTNLVGNSHLTINGGGTNRLLSIVPGLHKSGTATITVIASDSQPASTTNSFSLTVVATNYPPTFTAAISNQQRNENSSATNWSFAISDIETPVSNLTVTASSTNTSLVPNANLVLSGTGANRSLTVAPATNQNGVTQISVVVTDGGGATATNDFLLNILAVNQPPTFSLATNRLVLNENAGLITNALISNISSGPPNQSSESNHFVLNYSTNFYAQAPAVDTNGILTFQVATNGYGSSTIQFVLTSSGSTTNGGRNSLTNSVSLQVYFVNQAPSFNLSTNFFVANEETPGVTNAAFANTLNVGAANQAGQTWTFAALTSTNNSTNTLFAVLPAIATNGTLTFKPAPHSYGTNLVTVIMTTSGSPTNGGVNTATNTFSLAVVPVAHAPVIVPVTNLVVALENATNVSTTVTLWDYDLAVSNFVLTAAVSNASLASIAITATNIVNASNAVYTLNFTLGTNFNGTSSVQLIASEAGLNSTNTFSLLVKPVNQAPSFNLSTNFFIANEETPGVTNVGFANTLNVGAANQAGQTWTFAALTSTNNSTNALFAVLPAIATNGTLTFKPASHSYGTNLVTVIMTTSGSLTNGGVNTATNTFSLAVVPGPHAPFIVPVTNLVVALENATNVSTTVTLWDYDLAVSNFVLTAAVSNASLASIAITATNIVNASNAVYTLNFTLGTNFNGTSSVQLIASEAGLNSTNTFSLLVKPVNQPPSFNLSTNFFVANEETPGVTNVGFANTLNVGAANQAGQTWTFATLTSTNNATNALFAVLPAIATNGTLIFKPAPHSYGTNLVTVIMTTSGSLTNGGVNAATNTFSLAVVPGPHAPFIVPVTNLVVALENATNVSTTVTLWDYDLAVSNFVLTAAVSNASLASIAITATNIVNASNAVYTLNFTLGTNFNGASPVQLIASEAGLNSTNTFSLLVKPVNQAPSFNLSTNFFVANEETPGVTNVGFANTLNVGAANQAGQTWTFATLTSTNNATNALFAVLPAIATNGTLIFKPAPHSYGTNLVTVIMTTSGSLTNGGVNAATNTFSLAVVPGPHAPFIVPVTNLVVALENATNVSTTVTLWDYDLAVSNFVLTAAVSNASLASIAITATNIVNASNAVYTLNFTLGTNFNGASPVRLIASEAGLNSTNTFSLLVKPVNQAPSFNLSTNFFVANEETPGVTNVGFANTLNVGAANQAGQTWTFATLTSTNNSTNALFAVLPAIATNGTLIFKPAPHSYGTNLVTVIMTTSGSLTNGGVNAATNTFSLAVVPGPHAPFIVPVTNLVVALENATNVSTTVTLWDYDLAVSNFVLTAAVSNASLASIAITATNIVNASNAVYTLNFTLGTNFNGASPVRLIASEAGLNSTNTFSLLVKPVNQAPSFNLSTNFFVANEETPGVTNAAFANTLNVGAANQAGQTWTFATLTSTNNSTNALFAVLPAIATNGTLTFKPTPHSYGTNLVTVIMTTSGSLTNGGVNTATNTFSLAVVPVSHAPVIVPVTNLVVALENATNVSTTVTLWDYDLAVSNFVLTAAVSNASLASIAITATNIVNASNAVYTLNFTLGTNFNGASPVQLIASEAGLNSTNTFSLLVKPVNQAPSFNLSTNFFVANEETPGVTNVGFANTLNVGAANQAGQTWTFAALTSTNNATNALFAVLPAIATNGTLIFKPAPHSYGTNLVTVIMTTSGSLTNGGVNTATNTFSLAVAPVSHAPVIVPVTNLVVALENATNVSTTVTLWDYDLAVSNFVLTAAVSNASLASIAITATNIVNASNAVYTLNFTLGTNFNGASPVQLIASEAGLNSTNTFSLLVKPVNQAPSFNLSTNFFVANEETPGVTNAAFVNTLNVGAANQAGQTWTFAALTSTNNATNALFAVLPAIATNGTLIFKPAPHSYGTNLVTVIMTTSGSLTNGGVNTATNTFSLAVAPVSHAPVIVPVTNLVVALENATNVSTTVTLWDYDLAVSNFVLTAAVSNASLASIAITATNIVNASNAVYTLNFTLGTNFNGTSPVQLIASEAGLNSTNTFSLLVKPVNQAPSFNLSTNFFVANEETPGVTNAAFVNTLNVGAANQAGQTWTFATLTSTNNATNALFAVLPAIATNGTLIFKPAPHSYGTNLVTVIMTTSGSPTNGGVIAATNTFSLAVAPVSHAPVIVPVTNLVVALENATNVSTTVTLWDYDLAVSNFVLTAAVSNASLASIAITATNIVNASNAVYTLNFTLGTNFNGTSPVQLIASEAGLNSTNTFSLLVKPVNQAPSFNLSTNFFVANEETPGVTNAAFVNTLNVGAANQAGQTWTFATLTSTNNATNALFAVLPAIATNGTLIFKPAPHSYGTNLVTVIMTTSGSLTNGGVIAATNSFSLAVVPVSHAPVIVPVTNLVVALENATNISTTVTLWDYDLAVSNFVLTAAVSNASLASVAITATNIVNASNAVYTLNFTLGTNFNGNSPVQLIASEAGLNSTNSVTLWIKPVNQPPSFTFATNALVVAENAGLLTENLFVTNISVGAANQSTETWAFAVLSTTNNATNATFAQVPAIATNGTLTFKTGSYSFGTNLITVVMTTSGSLTNGGVNACTNTFALEVMQVAYPPAIIGLTNKTMLENATTNLSMPFTLFDPLTTNFNVTSSSANTNVVNVSVTGSGTNRTLVFAPLTNAIGTNAITVTVDDGSLTNSVTITNAILWVNQAPSFNLAVPTITVDEYNVAISLANVATNIQAGPTNESGQTVTFVVTNSNPNLFVSPPTVSSLGTLNFTPGRVGGTVTVGIRALDNGGTANGGVNTSATQTLTITIPPNAFQYLTGSFTGLFYDINTPSAASAGYFSLILANDGSFDGYIDNMGGSNGFSGQFSISNSLAQVTTGNYKLMLNIDTSGSWTESISGSVSNTAAGWSVPLDSYLAGYSATFQTGLAGSYTAAMPGLDDPAAGPYGDSVFTISISSAGVVGLTGNLADDAGFVETNQLSVDGYCPIYTPLYGNGSQGVLIGWLQFTGDASNGLDTNSILTWIDQAGATANYPGGFTNQAAPFASTYTPSADAALPFSSGTFILSGGNLSASITNSIAVSANVITVDPTATNGVSLYINTATGELLGSFVYPSGHTNYIDAAILQNANMASGYFVGTNRGGWFLLNGN